MDASIGLKTIRLNNVSARRIKAIEGGGFELKRNTKIEVSKIENKDFNIKVTETLGCDPQGLFELTLEIVGEYRILDSIEPEKIEENEVTLAEPIMHYISFVVGFLTEKMLDGPPLIIPPIYDNE